MADLTLWADRYKPRTLDDYVFTSEKKKKQVQGWIESRQIPHLLLHGKPGTGKTSLLDVILSMLEVSPHNILAMNASRDNGVDEVRNKIVNFCSTAAFDGEKKYVKLDEADYLSTPAMAALRGTIEEFQHGAVFMLTCNYVARIMDAIRSRCNGQMKIEALNRDDYTTRLINILMAEGVPLNDEALAALDVIVETCYPDMRRAIGLCQQNYLDGQLETPDEEDLGGGAEWMRAVEDYFDGSMSLRTVRKAVCTSAARNEYEDIFTYLYQNVFRFAADESVQERVILAVRDGIVKHAGIGDPEINLAATFINIQMILEDSK